MKTINFDKYIFSKKTHYISNSGKDENGRYKGGGGAHNHGFTGTATTISTMPPYLVIYMWERTA